MHEISSFAETLHLLVNGTDGFQVLCVYKYIYLLHILSLILEVQLHQENTGNKYTAKNNGFTVYVG